MYAGGKFAQILLFFTPVAIITSVVFTRRDVRAVEGACLENKCAGNGTVGSNPTLSAINRYRKLCYTTYHSAKILNQGAQQLFKILRGAIGRGCRLSKRA